MAHYAFLNDSNIVTEVIVGIDEDAKDDLPSEFDSWEEFYADFRGQTCKRTSYNTIGNEHNDSGTAFRGNYAGIGYTYDEDEDVFIPPQPYPSWILNEANCRYDPPIEKPECSYVWNELHRKWEEVNYE